MSVTTSTPVDGAWAWLEKGGTWTLHWRPKSYWPAHTQVTVTASLYGLEISPGHFGAANLEVSFSIGRSQIVYADAEAKSFVIRQSGAGAVSNQAYYPSGLNNHDPRWQIHSGTHVVTGKTQNAPGGDYPPNLWAVAVSDAEYVSSRPTPTHSASSNWGGGIELSLTAAREFYGSALVGDPVVVIHTTEDMRPSDGGDTDWCIPWAQWLTMGA